MSLYPVMLQGSDIDAVIVGGGPVAARKARALLDAAARVRVIARDVSADVRALPVTLLEKSYEPADLRDASLVIAATNDAALNAAVAADARARRVLVNVVDDPELGSCVTPAVHRAGDVVVAVSAGGVPTAARRIRDAIARIVDDRYAAAVGELSKLRRSLLDDARRDRWHQAADALIGPDFADEIQSDDFAARVAQWR